MNYVRDISGKWQKKKKKKKKKKKIVQEITRNVANVFSFYAIIAIELVQCINVRQVPWELLKTAAFGLGFHHLPRDLAMLMHEKNMFDPFNELYILFHLYIIGPSENVSLNTHRIQIHPMHSQSLTWAFTFH